MLKWHTRPPLDSSTKIDRDFALEALSGQPDQFFRVAWFDNLNPYQLYLWAEEEGIETALQPPCPRTQMILHMVNELGVRWAARQLRVSEGLIDSWTSRYMRWWQQPPKWQPGTKITLRDDVFTVITVYDGLCGCVMDRAGNVLNPFQWRQGGWCAQPLGIVEFATQATRMEPYEDPRGKRPRFMAITSAMRDLGCGMTVKEVGTIFGRSEATISTWAKERGVTVDWMRRYNGPIPTDRDRAIMRMAGEVGPSETARRFTLSREYVHRLLKRFAEAGWREAPGWEPGETIVAAGNEYEVAAVYDADVGAVWDGDGKLINPFYWNTHEAPARSKWAMDQAAVRRNAWRQKKRRRRTKRGYL